MTAPRPEVLERERELYTVAECCRRNSISRATLYRLLAAGTVRAVKAGTRTLITAESLRGWRSALPTFLPTDGNEIAGNSKRQPETEKAPKRQYHRRRTGAA